MYAANAHDKNFLQNMNSEMETQTNRDYLYEKEIRKHEMLIEKIEIKQKLMSQQLLI
jgi:hypothetical protein